MDKLTPRKDTGAYAPAMSRTGFRPLLNECESALSTTSGSILRSTLTVAWCEGVWEVRDGGGVLSWTRNAADAVREARLIAGTREPCQIIVYGWNGALESLQVGWEP